MDADEWNARYAEAARTDRGLVWSAEPNATIADALADAAPGTAIDLGTGEGRHALWLAARGWQVTAVDFSDVGMVAGRRVAQDRGFDIDWVVADATRWQPSGKVDLVLLAYLHLPRPALTDLVRRTSGWLAPQGTLVVLGHDLANLTEGVGGPQDADLLPDEALLRDAASGLAIERCGTLTRTVNTDEGTRAAIDVLLVAHAPSSGR
jgi:SAM-dependent methyltransferase